VVNVSTLPHARTCGVIRFLADRALVRGVWTVFQRTGNLLARSRHDHRVHKSRFVHVGHIECNQSRRRVANSQVVVVNATGCFQNIVLIEDEPINVLSSLVKRNRANCAIIQKVLPAFHQSFNDIQHCVIHLHD
jgi:hypothetical protein